MEVSSELVLAARKGKRDAIVELLAAHYPTVWRMGTGLTGRLDVGRGVARHIMQRSLRVLETWKDEASPTRWFHHHTVLTARRAEKHSPDLTNDTFLRDASTDTGYVAFIRALRTLPIQQREAFILSNGEKLGNRALAVAMDCSMIAAENHLKEATTRLRELSGPHYEPYLDRMIQAYQRLGLDEEMSVQHVRERVQRIMIPWRVLRTLEFIASLILLAITLWGTMWVWRIVRHSMS
jgi:DNA-directed RNA polymerase specialized sigma24 family protein